MFIDFQSPYWHLIQSPVLPDSSTLQRFLKPLQWPTVIHSRCVTVGVTLTVVTVRVFRLSFHFLEHFFLLCWHFFMYSNANITTYSLSEHAVADNVSCGIVLHASSVARHFFLRHLIPRDWITFYARFFWQLLPSTAQLSKCMEHKSWFAEI